MDDGERNWLARENGILARMRKDWTGRSEKAGERRVGLARALSKLGYCSRAKAAELIVRAPADLPPKSWGESMVPHLAAR